MAMTIASEEGALTAADLHLDDDNDDEDDDEDDDQTEYTDRTDDDSFLENSSLTKMMKNSIQMLDSLTDEMNREFGRGEVPRGIKNDNTKSSTGSEGAPPNPTRIVTPSSLASNNQSNNTTRDEKRFNDMTIRVEFDSNMDKQYQSSSSSSTTTTPANKSLLTVNIASPLTSPIYAATVKNVADAVKLPLLDDGLTTPRTAHPHNDYHDTVPDDDLSLDDSLVNEMNALKQVALELERELNSTDLHTVQEAIERIGNSDDPIIKSVLESDDKAIIRKIIDEEIQRNEPKQQVLRYLYKAFFNTLTEDETTRLLTAVAALVWSIVLGLLLRAMTVEVVA
ncbi:hypothetical protein IV203_001269 [Nitzschia inconspicua]|uniref:Uncharacterized protein n=1 Tax=Nitzschia inconspicua TaxID=303405 RepID=A0A9K3L874_9STRA|nr:hypothetical protein IV203_001269 [Nitzschia inconspicua]